MNACRTVMSDCTLPNDPSAAAKLWEMTWARPWSTTYCSAAIIWTKP